MSSKRAAAGAAPDFQGAVAHALFRLYTELPPHLVYHGVEHTEQGVLPATQHLARMMGLGGRERMLLAVAAAYHDLGFIEIVDGHETLSVAIARAALPGFGFSAADIASISGLILATRLPQSPKNVLEQLMADADLDVLGRADFPRRSEALRLETANLGADFDDAAWACRQLDFLRSHRYFTAAALALRGPGKAANIAWLEACCVR